MSLDDYQSDHFSHDVQGDVTVVTIEKPKLSEDLNLEEFGEQLFAYVDQYDCLKLVLNCNEVNYASSSAIGKLITLHRKRNRVEGQLVMCCLQSELTEILQAARLYSYFKVAENADSAIALLNEETE